MNEHDELLRELGSKLPWDRPDAARRNAVRSSLLVAAAESTARPSPRWYVIGGAFAAGALTAAAVLLLVLRSHTDPVPVTASRIDASPGAEYKRHVTNTATGVDEVVRVRAGTLHMAVDSLRAGDHVRVATRDAEVEGDGAYAVEVVADELRAVDVKVGSATVRTTGQRAVFLASGQSWRSKAIVAHVDLPAPEPISVRPPAVNAKQADPIIAPPVVATHDTTSKPLRRIVEAPQPRLRIEHSAPVAAVPSVAESPVAESRVAESPVAESPATEAPAETEPSADVSTVGPKLVERYWKAGMALLKAGKAAEAARELIAAADVGGDDPLASDARYFAAAALTKAGRKTEAERVLVAFIDRAPKSIRRGRAAVMLARLIAERGDRAAARAWFESALGDPDAAVVAAARAGIASLH